MGKQRKLRDFISEGFKITEDGDCSHEIKRHLLLGRKVMTNLPVAAAAASAKSLQSSPTLCDPIDGSPPGSLSLGFSRQEYWSFSFSTNPSKEYPGLISFRMDWLDLPVVQGTLKTLLQHCSLKTSILQWSNFFIVQLSHPYMTTGKIIILTICIFVSKVMSLLFSTLSRFVIAFLPRSKHLLISWL